MCGVLLHVHTYVQGRFQISRTARRIALKCGTVIRTGYCRTAFKSQLESELRRMIPHLDTDLALRTGAVRYVIATAASTASAQDTAASTAFARDNIATAAPTPGNAATAAATPGNAATAAPTSVGGAGSTDCRAASSSPPCCCALRLSPLFLLRGLRRAAGTSSVAGAAPRRNRRPTARNGAD